MPLPVIMGWYTRENAPVYETIYGQKHAMAYEELVQFYRAAGAEAKRIITVIMLSGGAKQTHGHAGAHLYGPAATRVIEKISARRILAFEKWHAHASKAALPVRERQMRQRAYLASITPWPRTERPTAPLMLSIFMAPLEKNSARRRM